MFVFVLLLMLVILVLGVSGVDLGFVALLFCFVVWALLIMRLLLTVETDGW